MYCLRWSDRHRSSLVIGDRDSIDSVYSMLVRERERNRSRHGDEDDGPHAIHVYDANTGLEMDPERGMEAKVFLAAEDAGEIAVTGGRQSRPTRPRHPR